MKKTLEYIMGVLGLFLVPYSMFMTYTLYQHVQAPELLWTMWVLQVPFILLIKIIEMMVKRAED